jgi:predicted amidohydrolase
MKIGLAQVRSTKGDIAANLSKHITCINLAASHSADVIFFPELSITGYEPALAKELAIAEDDARFTRLQIISDANSMSIAIGAPLKAGAGVQIGLLVFQPDQPRLPYSKQLLHADEIPLFTRGNKDVMLTIKDKKIAPAICFESLQMEHVSKANKLGADIYVATVAKPKKGVDKAFQHYPEVAKKFMMPVLMCNCVGYCDNFESAGCSSVWSKQGICIEQLDSVSEGILIFDTATEQASAVVI